MKDEIIRSTEESLEQVDTDKKVSRRNFIKGTAGGGPNSVPGQLADDARLTESLTGRTMLQKYFDWKDGVREKHGLDFSVDYTMGLVGAANTLNTEDTFAGGAARFFGRWDLIGRDSGNTGTFVWKIEHRHKYTDIPPSGTASQVG